MHPTENKRKHTSLDTEVESLMTGCEIKQEPEEKPETGNEQPEVRETGNKPPEVVEKPKTGNDISDANETHKTSNDTETIQNKQPINEASKKNDLPLNRAVGSNFVFIQTTIGNIYLIRG